MSERPSTPPPGARDNAAGSPMTPEQVRRMEISRLKAKALREQREADNASRPSQAASSVAGVKRSYTAFSQQSPASNRDARARDSRPLESIQPARMAKYIDYDFSKMTDTKGGFMTAEDDPHNKALHTQEKDNKPTGMTQKEWEKQQLMRSLRSQKAGPFEPGISAIQDETDRVCRECGAREVDWKWLDIFSIAVCQACKDKLPEKYSLLTKTEVKADYLLTEPELKDESLLPHLERPNPHKATWHNMFLYLRCQVEDYAFSDQRWGSADALDAEFEKRQADTKRRKETKFKNKLAELKKRTRYEAHKRSRQNQQTGKFGDDMGDGRHVHEFGRAVDNAETGVPVKTCITCGLEVEELEL
jgi:DNA-repair protein complementing XP-A cells